MPKSAHHEQIVRQFKQRVDEISGCHVDANLQPGRTFNGPGRTSLADFDAAGDGVADDTAAVQLAVDKLLAGGGGILVLPPGKYLVDTVACGPGITFWGYGATILKPGIRFYCRKHLDAVGVVLAGEALEHRIEELRTLAFEIEQATMNRAIATLKRVVELTDVGQDAGLDEPATREAGNLMTRDELEAFRGRVGELLERQEISDRELLELTEQLRGGRSQAKWARTFHTGHPHRSVPTYRYLGDDDSPPLAFMGLRFDGNRREMGRYEQYELEQQHMILLDADPRSPGRLSAWVRDVCLEDGVGDGISVHRNVDVTIRNVVATDVFRGAVTCTGGNSRIDMADLRAGGEDHPTGIDWEIDGGSFVRDGAPTAAPSYRTETVAANLELAGDFDVALNGGSFHGEQITVHGPPFNLSAAGDSEVVIRDSSFAVGNVLASHRADDIRSGRYVSVIRHPHSVLFDNVEFVASLPAASELNRPLAFYSLLVLIMTTQYHQPRQSHLHFRRCRFVLPGAAQDGAETRALSTSNDVLASVNGTLFEGCTFEAAEPDEAVLDYALHIGGGAGAYGNWGSAGGGYFRFLRTRVMARVAAFVGGNDRYRTHADLRGVEPGAGFDHLFDRPENQDDAWITIWS